MLKRNEQSVYLDYAASTPLDPTVVAAMQAELESDALTANASSTTHAAGRRAGERVEQARADVAALVGAVPADIVFTSGATEADNLALFGTARYRRGDGRHILGARTEHKAITDSLKQLAVEGFDVEWLPVDAAGAVTLDAVESRLRDDTILVTVMAVNNELGTISDVGAIARLCRARGISCHVDAAQVPGKLGLDIAAVPADTIALSAHKMYGPKGIGALVCPAEFAPRLTPLLFGGGQERGLRPGTPATHQAVGFGQAAKRCIELATEDNAWAKRLSERLVQGLVGVPGVQHNAVSGPRVPHIVSVSVADVNGESLVYAMDPIAVSTGSACATARREPSAVLHAIGLDSALAESTLRFSLGRFTSEADVDAAIAQFSAAVGHLRAAGAEPEPVLRP
ncbi:MAG: cysteine desulfurase family protein [Pseudomonadota bacterium]